MEKKEREGRKAWGEMGGEERKRKKGKGRKRVTSVCRDEEE